MINQQHQSCLELLGHTKKMVEHIETSKKEIRYYARPLDLRSGKFCIGDGTYPNCTIYNYDCDEFADFVKQHNRTKRPRINIWDNSNKKLEYKTFYVNVEDFYNQIITVDLN